MGQCSTGPHKPGSPGATPGSATSFLLNSGVKGHVVNTEDHHLAREFCFSLSQWPHFTGKIMGYSEVVSSRLRTEVNTLAAKARLIRKEEHRAADDEDRGCIRCFRVEENRKKARCTLLAYAAIRGVPYSRVEARSSREPDWEKVEEIVRQYHGFRGVRKTLKWFRDAKRYYRKQHKTFTELTEESPVTDRVLNVVCRFHKGT